jgi:hypothetical protein
MIYEITSQNVQYTNTWLGGATGEHRKAHHIVLSGRPEGLLVGIMDVDNPGWAVTVDSHETGSKYLSELGFTSSDGVHWTK